MGMEIWEYMLILQKCNEDEGFININNIISMLKLYKDK